MATKTWTKKDTKVVLVFSDIVILIALTAGFMGFHGFKSLGLVAIALFIGFISFGIFVIGFFGGKISKKPVWKNLRIGGSWMTIADIIFVSTQMIGQIG